MPLGGYSTRHRPENFTMVNTIIYVDVHEVLQASLVCACERHAANGLISMKVPYAGVLSQIRLLREFIRLSSSIYMIDLGLRRVSRMLSHLVYKKRVGCITVVLWVVVAITGICLHA